MTWACWAIIHTDLYVLIHAIRRIVASSAGIYWWSLIHMALVAARHAKSPWRALGVRKVIVESAAIGSNCGGRLRRQSSRYLLLLPLASPCCDGATLANSTVFVGLGLVWANSSQSPHGCALALTADSSQNLFCRYSCARPHSTPNTYSDACPARSGRCALCCRLLHLGHEFSTWGSGLNSWPPLLDSSTVSCRPRCAAQP